MAYTPDPALEAEIVRLDGLGLPELRELWAERLGAVPKHQSADLMRRRLAYELQVLAYGGLKSETRRRLRRLYEAFKADPNYTPLPNYGLKPGTMLTREFKGITHRVGVMDDGFEYRGERYQSLSKIATLIAGTKWSGPAFFGFREPRR
jgi:Protein of unknown function (DUF2924)